MSTLPRRDGRRSQLDEMLAEIVALFPEGWEIDSEVYGLDFNLICPHGHMIEQDGECPDGCVSPLRAMGLI